MTALELGGVGESYAVVISNGNRSPLDSTSKGDVLHVVGAADGELFQDAAAGFFFR